MFSWLINWFRKKYQLLERRTFRRYQLDHFRCICIYTDHDKEIRHPVVVVDISEGGLLMITENVKIYPDTPVTIELKYPETDDVILLTGVIVRTYRREHGMFYRSGVEFKGMDKEKIKQVIKTITIPARTWF